MVYQSESKLIFRAFGFISYMPVARVCTTMITVYDLEKGSTYGANSVLLRSRSNSA